MPELISELRKLLYKYNRAKISDTKYAIRSIQGDLNEAHEEIKEATGFKFLNLLRIADINDNRLDRDLEKIDLDILEDIVEHKD